jgi:hypothetical protein
LKLALTTYSPLLPHCLRSTSIEGLHCKPTVHSHQRAFTVFTLTHTVLGGWWRERGARVSGVAAILACIEVYWLVTATTEGGGGGDYS